MSNDRIADFLNAAGNDELGLSAGSVYGFCRKLAGNAEESILNLEEELLNHEVVLTDATTVTVNGEQNYIILEQTTVNAMSISSVICVRTLRRRGINGQRG